jgi:hypothetical protein
MINADAKEAGAVRSTLPNFLTLYLYTALFFTNIARQWAAGFTRGVIITVALLVFAYILNGLIYPLSTVCIISAVSCTGESH